ncbi:MAG TPA: carboxymuconolactone decarboxylase family protein [Kofleriaceae bacterium]|jgi:AhpD family alkylhydroperoxidase
MQRLKNPGALLPNALPHLYALAGTPAAMGLPKPLLELVHMRISQINACSFCIELGWRNMTEAGEKPERMFGVAGWRHTNYFSAEERAALALAEAVTRLADKEDAVPDELWAEVTANFDEQKIAGLLLHIGMVNVWNRFNVPARVLPAPLSTLR